VERKYVLSAKIFRRNNAGNLSASSTARTDSDNPDDGDSRQSQTSSNASFGTVSTMTDESNEGTNGSHEGTSIQTPFSILTVTKKPTITETASKSVTALFSLQLTVTTK
jgi:hypothetical protein